MQRTNAVIVKVPARPKAMILEYQSYQYRCTIGTLHLYSVGEVPLIGVGSRGRDQGSDERMDHSQTKRRTAHLVLELQSISPTARPERRALFNVAM